MNLNNSGCTSSNRKLKGFTLIEVLTVIAIIGVIAGMMSIVMRGFRRDALIETQNDNARMVFTAFQDILIDCEINQDKSLFNPYEYNDIDIVGAWVFFRISDRDYAGNKMANPGTGLGDEIHINTRYSDNVFNGMPDTEGVAGSLTGLSVWASGTTQNSGGGANNVNYAGYGPDGGAHIWDKWETAINGRIDPKMEGTYCVQMDLENYEVISVVCRNLIEGRDPKTGLWDENEVTGTGGFVLKNYTYDGKVGVVNADYITPIDGAERKLPLGAAFVKNKEAERQLADKHAVYVGSYPLFDDVYKDFHN